MRVVLCVQGCWLVALATPGQFPHDTAGHHGGGCAAEVAACSGHRHIDKCVEARAEQASLSSFLFSPACLY